MSCLLDPYAETVRRCLSMKSVFILKPAAAAMVHAVFGEKNSSRAAVLTVAMAATAAMSCLKPRLA